jgi:superfamily II DNA or RNA helicase
MTTDTIEVSAPTRKTLGAQSPSIPRPHQINLLANIRGEIRNGGRRMAAQAVTGFGKTIVAATMAKGVLDRGNRVIFAVPALSLIDQTMTKFRAEGINEIGVIQADHPLTNPMMPVQIASVQTLMKREIPAADLVVIDEDYHEGDLGEAMNKNGLVADVVETWQRLGQGRPSLCFAVDRSHARNLQTQFLAAGVRCGYVDAYTTADERDEIRRQFHAGEIEIVTNVGVLTTGVDWDVGAIILARPTQSEMLFTRMIGRGLRTAEGKTDCLILDHSDNHERLGWRSRRPRRGSPKSSRPSVLGAAS